MEVKSSWMWKKCGKKLYELEVDSHTGMGPGPLFVLTWAHIDTMASLSMSFESKVRFAVTVMLPTG